MYRKPEPSSRRSRYSSRPRPVLLQPAPWIRRHDAISVADPSHRFREVASSRPWRGSTGVVRVHGSGRCKASTPVDGGPRGEGPGHRKGVPVWASGDEMELEHQQLDLRYERLRVESPERQRRLVASMAERGQLVPIVVVAADDSPDHHVVIDGYKRVRALLRLGQDVVQAVRWDVSEFEALLLGRSLRTSGGETALEEAWFLDELRRRFCLDLEDLARRFDRSVSWVSRRLALVGELPDAVQEHVRRGKIVPHAAMKYLVPLARANAGHCERLASGIARHEMSSREVGELYACWREATKAIRDRIVEDPALFLRTRQALAGETSLAQEGETEHLVRDVHLLAAIARRIRRQWRTGIARQLPPPEREALAGGIRLASAEIQKVVNSLSTLENDIDDSSGDPDRDPRDGAKGGGHPTDRTNARDLATQRSCGPEIGVP